MFHKWMKRDPCDHSCYPCVLVLLSALHYHVRACAQSCSLLVNPYTSQQSEAHLFAFMPGRHLTTMMQTRLNNMPNCFDFFHV